MRLICLGLVFATTAAGQLPDRAFEQAVQPVLAKHCAGCHQDRLASGGFNATPYMKAASLSQRDDWERIVQRLRTGEMPPKGAPAPTAAEAQSLIRFVEGEFAKADKLVKPDPGRVTARRLNRAEYSNTIRDLLGVDFRADRDFPSDDSGHGFDNIGDVLTISPILMEKYLTAAERIAARAIGADPLPQKPLEFEYHAKDKTIRRPNRSSIEATHRVEWEAEYIVRLGLPGERAAGAAPVKLGFWMDGKLLTTKMVETKPSGLVYFNPYSAEELRVALPEGDHTFRAGFIDDEFVKGLSEKDAYSDKRNKFLNSMTFVGPFAAKGERPSRKKLLICDPNLPGCTTRILTSIARRAYRRPVTRAEVASLERFVTLAKADGQSAEQGIQLALQAMLVSPHFLFRIERDPAPGVVHPVTDLDLASRLSYFLWSSMPDEELLALAEAKQLRPKLDAQIQRMLKDDKAVALADNFAGQWLETRNLDQVKPDPKKFPEWSPDLRDAMKTETRLFFQHLLRENRPLTEFLDANYTFLNDRLAAHYGVPGVEGPEFRQVTFSTPERGGILSHASVLTVSSYPTRTSPVIRGKYVLQNILGTPPPPPPPDVPALDEASVGNAGSLRQQMEKHRSSPVCASCHSRMDVLGFGLENYDGTGKWRTRDGKFDIDASGTLPGGKTFQSPAELRTLLKDNAPEFSRCLTEKMLTYALGRGLERYDRKTIEEINQRVIGSGYRFESLVREIVHSLPFLERRGESPKNLPAKTESASR
ncbi:MAG: DUF1592 domain-containing protein [Bryobacteraceae bacterium]|nr:DUF1592 domain-containing protein [Bryobacteraceae bacterium]